MEVRRAQSAELRIQVRKQASLQQRVFAEIDSRHDVARAECHLLGFCKKVVRISVQYHLADHLDGHDFLGNQLGGIQNVERQFIRGFVVQRLESQLELRKIPACDGLKQI